MCKDKNSNTLNQINYILGHRIKNRSQKQKKKPPGYYEHCLLELFIVFIDHIESADSVPT